MEADESRGGLHKLRQIPEIVDVCAVVRQSVVAVVGQRKVGRRQRRRVVPRHVTERVGRIPPAARVLGVYLPLDLAASADGVGLRDVRPVCISAERGEAAVRERACAAIPAKDVSRQATAV